jgi:WD40 repeat protein
MRHCSLVLVVVCFFTFTLQAQLRITQPNSATPIQGGTDVEIRWVNDAPAATANFFSDSVRVEYSTNAGVTWQFLADVRGSSYLWRNTPAQPTRLLALRVSEIAARIPHDALPSANGMDGARHLVLSAAQSPSQCAGLAINIYPQAFWKPDGKQVALLSGAWDDNGICQLATTGSATFVVRVFDAETGSLLQRFSMQRTIVFEKIPYFSPISYGLDILGTQQNFWSPDGRQFSWWQDERTLAVWDAATWQIRGTLPVPRLVGNVLNEYNIAWKTNGAALLLYNLQSQLQVVNQTINVRGQTFTIPTLQVSSLTRNVQEWQVGSTIGRTVLDAAGCLETLTTNFRNLIRDIGSSAQFSNNRQMLAVGCNDGGIKVFNLQNRDVMRSLIRNEIYQLASDAIEFTDQPFARNMAWSPNDELLAIWGLTGNNNDDNASVFADCNCRVSRIMILNIATGERKVIQLPLYGRYWTNVAWSQDGRSLVVTGDVAGMSLSANDGDAIVIDVQSSDVALADTLTRFREFEQNAAGTQYGRWNNQENFWNPDNARFAGGTAQKLDLWDGRNGYLAQRITFPSLTDLNRTVSWSPDGTKILSTTRMRTNAARDTSAMIFRIPAVNRAISEPLTVLPVPILSVPTLASVALNCEAQVTMRIPLTNRGGADVIVSSATVRISTSAALPAVPALPSEFRVISAPTRISAGRTESVLVAYSSNRIGVVRADLDIVSNSLGSLTQTIPLQGRKDSSGFRFVEPIFDIPNTTPGLAVFPSFAIQNTGTVPLTFSRIAPLAASASGGANGSANVRLESVMPNPLPGGQTGFVDVTIVPPAREGRFQERLTLQSLGDCPRSASVLVSGGRSAFIEAQDTINAPPVLCGANPVFSLPFRNTGNQNLRVREVIPLGINPTEFQLLDWTQDVPPNTTGTVQFAFTPTSNGAKSLTVDLISNAANASRKTMVLNVRKDTVFFSLQSPSVLLSTEQERTPISQTVRLTNRGTVPLRWQTPIAFGSDFTITSIDPPETPPNGGVSLVTVEYRGGVAGQRRDTTITLTEPICGRSVALQVLAQVVAVPRLSAQLPTTFNLLCENSGTASVRLRNDGTGDVRIDRATLVGQNASEFRIESTPQGVMRGSVDSLRIRFTPTSLGAKQVEVEILSTAREGTIRLPIAARKDSSGLLVFDQRLDFGAVPVQTEAFRTFALANTGSIPQQFSLPVQSGEFTLVSITPNPVPPNTRAQGVVRLFSTQGGTFTRRFTLQDSCARQSVVECTARVAGGIASLQASIETAPGREVEVPIWLRSRTGGSMGTSLSAQIRIGNASMLEPSDSMRPASNIVQNGARILTYTTTIASQNENEPVLRLKLRGLLGSDSVTTLRLDSLIVGGVALPLSIQTMTTSQVRMRGLNGLGGTRLFFATTPSLAIKGVSPNPASDALTLELDVTEETLVTARLVDMLGREHVAWSGSVAKGAETLDISTKNTAAGVYVLEVQYSCASDGQQRCRWTRQIVVVR